MTLFHLGLCDIIVQNSNNVFYLPNRKLLVLWVF